MGGGGDLLCFEIKDLEEGDLLSALSEESHRDWGVAGSRDRGFAVRDQR